MKDQFEELVKKYRQLEYYIPIEENSHIPYNRPSYDQVYMAIAQIVGLRSTCLRGKVGAVISKDTRIVSIGYNGAPSNMGHCIDFGCIKDTERGGCIRTIHAEQNSIVQAAKHGIAIEGATMYVKLEPCSVCAKMIINAGLKEVISHMSDGSNTVSSVDGWAEEWKKNDMTDDILKYDTDYSKKD